MNAFLETILTSIGFAFVVVDRHHHVRIWNSQARELWGLTSDKAEGEHLFSLDIGLPLEKLRTAIRAVLTDGSAREELTVQATSRRGKSFECHVTFLPLGPATIDGVPGAIIMMEPA